MRSFSFSSKSSPGTTYDTLWSDDGKLLCDCRGWTNKREGKPRECTHTKQVVAQFPTARVEVRGEHVYLLDGGTSASPSPLRAVATEAPRPASSLAPAPASPPAPMLASAVTESITGAAFDHRYGIGWLMEEKLDGHRLQVVVAEQDGRRVVTGYARPRAGTNVANVRTLPENITAELSRFPVGIYDGELHVPGGKSSDVVVLGAALVFTVFDLLQHEGRSWMGQSYSYRRAGLAAIFGAVTTSDVVRLAVAERPSWARVLEIWSRGGEGVILKHEASRYTPGARVAEWLKIKAKAAAVLELVGFEPGKTGPCGVMRLRDDEGRETTVKTLGNALLREVTANPDAYIGRRVVISYQERTAGGSYRHGIFDHFAGSAMTSA